MRFINKNRFWRELLTKYPNHSRRHWFAVSVFRKKGYGFVTPSRKYGTTMRINKTIEVLTCIGAKYPLVVFPDICHGWRGLPATRKYSPIEINGKTELEELLKNHVYRPEDKRDEDYHITDTTHRWFIVLFSDGSWYFIGRDKLLSSIAPIVD